MAIVRGRHGVCLELCKALGLPEETRAFTIKADVDSIVTVECECYPLEDGMKRLPPIFKRFELHEKEEVPAETKQE